MSQLIKSTYNSVCHTHTHTHTHHHHHHHHSWQTLCISVLYSVAIWIHCSTSPHPTTLFRARYLLIEIWLPGNGTQMYTNKSCYFVMTMLASGRFSCDMLEVASHSHVASREMYHLGIGYSLPLSFQAVLLPCGPIQRGVYLLFTFNVHTIIIILQAHL